MKNKKEINAGIIIIGNEVLSGRTKDINTSTLSLWLNSLGVQVKEVRIIPDIEKDIIDILVSAEKMGIETLDTAISYGDSIERLGSIGIQKFKI